MRTVTLVLLFLFSGLVYGQERKTENVFIITLDGYRWQELFEGADPALIGDKDYVRNPKDLKNRFWADTPEERRQRLTPFFWGTLAQEGQLYGNRAYGNHVDCSNTMWFSYPGYNEILCGFSDDERVRSNRKSNNPNVTVLEFLNNHASFRGQVAAFGSWDVFPFIINQERSGLPVNAGFSKASGANLTDREKFLNTLQDEIPGPWGGVRLDAFTHYFALEYLKKYEPRVMYIAYGETDDFAHDGRYDQYLISAQRTDKYIGELWDWVQSHRKYRDKTTFIITTDHGRGTTPLETWKNHGSQIAGAGEIWIAVIGPDTPPLGEVKQPGQLYQNQVAKTAAAFLGIDYRGNRKEGAIITSAFR